MGVKTGIIQGWRTLVNPEKEFNNLKKRALESVLEDYLKLLLVSGIAAGIASFLLQFGWALYLRTIKGLTIDFFRLLNYSSGTSMSMFFGYLFFGTFIAFLAIVILNLFIRKIKFIQLVPIFLYSIFPFLLFGWIYPALSFAMIIWCLFLLVVGIKSFNA